MSLTEVSTIASIVSSFAVAASLVYVALQTHQNAKHTMALIWSATEDRSVNLFLTMTDESLCRAAIVENGGEPTPEAIRQRQCGLMHTAMYLNSIDMLRQAEMGITERSESPLRVEMLRREPAYLRYVKSMLAIQKTAAMTPVHQRIHALLSRVVEEAERPA